VPTASVTRYPTTIEQRPGAAPAGEGPLGRAISAFVTCTVDGCQVVLDRADGSQVTIPAPVADTPVSLSPDGTRLVYLDRDATVVRNLITGVVHRARPLLQPISWSPDNRWLLSGLSQGSDFVVLDSMTGAVAVHEHPLPPSATAEPVEPVPTGPYFPGAVTDDGDIVRYPRPDTASTDATFELDVVDRTTAKPRRTVVVRLNSPAGHVTPTWQSPSMLTLGGTAYVLSVWKGAAALLPVPLSGSPAQPPRPVAVSGPGPRPSLAVSHDDGAWQAVTALPRQGLVYRVPGVDGDDLIAVDPTTGRFRPLTHVHEGVRLALAALEGP